MARFRLQSASLPGFTQQSPQASSWFGGSNRINGWSYDAAGNVLNYGSTSPVFEYDGENRVVKVTSSGATVVTYAYDGMGHRVQRTTTATTTYVYDAQGNLAAEYGPPSGANGTQYLTADMLGSTRLITSQTVRDKDLNSLLADLFHAA